MFRRHLLLARPGWLVQQPLILSTNTTPSAPSTVASQHSIDGAASPPQLRRGVIVSPKVVPQEVSMRIRFHLYVLLFVLLAGASLILADEGMWTFDNPPAKQLKEKYNFAPT